MIILPTIEEVIALHTAVVRKTSGSDGLRDVGILSGCMARLHTSFGGSDVYVGIFNKAAATLESIARNHPFFDGNKRTAFVTALYIIEHNGYRTDFDNKDIEDTVVRVVVAKLPIEIISQWLEKNSTSLIS